MIPRERKPEYLSLKKAAGKAPKGDGKPVKQHMEGAARGRVYRGPGRVVFHMYFAAGQITSPFTFSLTFGWVNDKMNHHSFERTRTVMKKCFAILLAMMMLLCTVCFAAAEETGVNMDLTAENIANTQWMKDNGWPVADKQTAEEKALLTAEYVIDEGITFKGTKLLYKTGTEGDLLYIMEGTETLTTGVQPAGRGAYLILSVTAEQAAPVTLYEKMTVLGTWAIDGKALQAAAKYDDPYYDKYFTECSMTLELREDGTYTLTNNFFGQEDAEEGTWTGSEKEFVLGESKEKISSIKAGELSIAEGNLKLTFTAVETAEPVVRTAPVAEEPEVTEVEETATVEVTAAEETATVEVTAAEEAATVEVTAAEEAATVEAAVEEAVVTVAEEAASVEAAIEEAVVTVAEETASVEAAVEETIVEEGFNIEGITSAADITAEKLAELGWTVAEDGTVTEELQAKFDTAFEGFAGAGCTAEKLIATKTLEDGTVLYLFEGTQTIVVPGAEPTEGYTFIAEKADTVEFRDFLAK